MVSALDRRALVRLFGAAALASLGATRAVARAAGPGPGQGLGRFVPPPGPMRYTRQLVRTMAGGYSLTVERSFAVRFEPAVQGFVVAGEQTGVEVEAPTTLAALAALERKRVETGLFPLRLDRLGRIMDAPGEPRLADIDQVLAATRAVIEQRPLTASERAEAAQFLALVHQSASGFLSHLPADLFAPVERQRVEQRTLDLPGEDGTVRVEFVAETDPRSGLMQHARREIVTRIGDQSRATREDWTLRPL